MYDEAINILIDTRTAFENEDTVLARSIFKRDDVLDAVNDNAPVTVAEVIKRISKVLMKRCICCPLSVNWSV